MENMTAARESSEGRRDVQGRTRECGGEWELCCQQGREREPWAEERETGYCQREQGLSSPQQAKNMPKGGQELRKNAGIRPQCTPTPPGLRDLLERSGAMVTGCSVPLFVL